MLEASAVLPSVVDCDGGVQDETNIDDDDDDGSLSLLPHRQPQANSQHKHPPDRTRQNPAVMTSNHSGYSFNPLSTVPRKRLNYHAPPGSESAFQSFDVEWMRIPKKGRVSSILDPNYPLPKMEYTIMEPYRLCGRDAPHRRAVFLIEQLHNNASHWVFSQSSPKRLVMTPDTSNVVGLQRGQTGMYLTNQSRSHVHYEEDSRKMRSFIGLAKQ
jgi:hypothetical protein